MSSKFSRELKDFVNGWKTGQDIMSKYTDDDYKRARTKLAGSQQGIYDQKLKDMQDPDARKLSQEDARSRIGYRAAMTDRLRNGPVKPQQPGALPIEVPGALISIPDVTPPAPAAPGPVSALPIDGGAQFAAEGGLIRDRRRRAVEEQADRADGRNPDLEDLKRQRTRGVLGYADGGLVEDDGDDDEEDDTLPAGATPTAGSRGFSYIAGHDAVREGMIYAQQHAGMGQRTGLPDQGQQGRGAMDYLRGKGASGTQLMQAVHDKIDPKRQMSEGQRNMAGLSAVYQFYLRQGEATKAKSAAASLLQQHRVNSQHYAALSRAALEGGNLDAAAMYASRAYANVPTGKDMKIVNENGRLVYTATDEATGKVIRKGVMTPQELGAAVTGFTPDQFDATVMQAAGVRAAKGDKGAKAPTGDKVSEVKGRTELIDSAAPAPGEGEKPDPGLMGVRSIADGIMQSNKIRGDEAVTIAKALIDPSTNAKKTPGEGGAYFQYKGGKRVFLSDDLIEQITDIRLEKQPVGDVPVGQSRAADDELGKKPGFVEGVGNAISEARAGAKEATRSRFGGSQRQQSAIDSVAERESARASRAAAAPRTPQREAAIPYDEE